MDGIDPARSSVTYLMVVQRGDYDRFRYLCTTFENKPVVVMWDRRTSERRRISLRLPSDRRRSDRRGPPPSSWDNLGFLVARRAAS